MSSVPPEPAPSASPRASTEILAAAGVSALFFAAFLVVPVVGPAALPFAAAPVARLAHRRGLAAALAASAIVAGLTLALGEGTGGAGAVTGAILAGVLTALPAMFAGAVARGLDPSRAYLGLCLAGLVAAGAIFLARSGASEAAMRAEIDRGFDEWQKLSNEPGRAPADPETAARVAATLSSARRFSQRYWPGLLGVSWVLGSAVGFYVGAWAGRPSPSAEASRFERLRLPATAAPLFVACGAAWALAPEPAARLAGNLLWPLLALYFVAGLSIICHFARKWFRTRILRVGLYALVVYVPINVGVALLGLFDWYADFRRRGEGAVEKS